MKYAFILITLLISLFLSFSLSMCSDQSPSASSQPTFQDTVYMVDMYYCDTITGKCKPPCSMSPDYCSCMRARGIVPDECR
jgi:hypothetical protein